MCDLKDSYREQARSHIGSVHQHKSLWEMEADKIYVYELPQ